MKFRQTWRFCCFYKKKKCQTDSERSHTERKTICEHARHTLKERRIAARLSSFNASTIESTDIWRLFLVSFEFLTVHLLENAERKNHNC